MTPAGTTSRRHLLGLLLALTLHRAASAQDGDAAAEIRTAFARYRQALLARDGQAAAAAVTRASHAWHERLRDLALAAPREQVAALPLADRLAVLRLRHEFTAAELAPLSGAELIAVSVAEAWSSPATLQKLELATIEATGDTATAAVARGGDATPIGFTFRREAGVWRLDLVALARAAEPTLAEALAELAARTGADPDRTLPLAIEHSSGHLVDKDLWQPLLPDPG
jgi:hypothetical protein